MFQFSTKNFLYNILRLNIKIIFVCFLGIFQMESDVTTMKKRIMESKQNEKSMKQTIRLQRDKSRQLITACAFKLQEKEAEVEKVGKYILYFLTNKNT